MAKTVISPPVVFKTKKQQKQDLKKMRKDVKKLDHPKPTHHTGLVASLAEHEMANKYDGRIPTKSQKGWDFVMPNGTKVEVKSMTVPNSPYTTYSISGAQLAIADEVIFTEFDYTEGKRTIVEVHKSTPSRLEPFLSRDISQPDRYKISRKFRKQAQMSTEDIDEWVDTNISWDAASIVKAVSTKQTWAEVVADKKLYSATVRHNIKSPKEDFGRFVGTNI